MPKNMGFSNKVFRPTKACLDSFYEHINKKLSPGWEAWFFRPVDKTPIKRNCRTPLTLGIPISDTHITIT